MRTLDGSTATHPPRTLRLFEIHTELPNVEGNRAVVVEGWLIGHGCDATTLPDPDDVAADEIVANARVEVWFILTCNGDFVTAVSGSYTGAGAGVPMGGPDMIEAGWLHRDRTLAGAAAWCFELIQQQPNLGFQAFSKAVGQASIWLERTRCSKSPVSAWRTPGSGRRESRGDLRNVVEERPDQRARALV